MENRPSHLDDLKDIKNIMQKSSRFTSLSGWGGIAAGCCALVGSWYVSTKVTCWKEADCQFGNLDTVDGINLKSVIVQTAFVTFAAALLFTYIFTYLRTKKIGTPLWNFTARRLIFNLVLPILVGGMFIYKMLDLGYYDLAPSACLLFYGLGLLNASKYTLVEVRYLGYGNLILGIVSCITPQYGLYFWAAGFGLLHIIYGIIMWYKYERD